MIENIRTLPVEDIIDGITTAAATARNADADLTLALTYAHRVMSPPLSLRTLSKACNLSPSTIRARVQAPDALDRLQDRLGRTGGSLPELNPEGDHDE